MAKFDKAEAAADAAPVAPPAVPQEPGVEVIDHEKARRAEALAAKRAAAKAKVGRYRVSFGELSGVYQARDADEARALFNDAMKTSTGPKVPGWKIERLPDAA